MPVFENLEQCWASLLHFPTSILLKPPSPLFFSLFLLENPAKTSHLLKLEVCICFLLFLIVEIHSLGLEDGNISWLWLDSLLQDKFCFAWYLQIWLWNFSTSHQKPTTYRAISARLWAWVASSWPFEVGRALAWCAPLTSVEWRNKK